jgi:hypothetical protein
MGQVENIDELLEEEFTDQPGLDFGAPVDTLEEDFNDDFGEPELEDDSEEALKQAAQPEVSEDESPAPKLENSEDRIEIPDEFGFKEPLPLDKMKDSFRDYQKYLVELLGDLNSETSKIFEQKLKSYKTDFSGDNDAFEEFASALKAFKDNQHKTISDLTDQVTSLTQELNDLRRAPAAKTLQPPPPAAAAALPEQRTKPLYANQPKKAAKTSKTPVESSPAPKSTFGILSFFLLTLMIIGSGAFAWQTSQKLKHNAYLDKQIEKKLDQANTIEEAIKVFLQRKEELEKEGTNR